AEVSDLNASLQENFLVITALKEQLNKLKGKAVLTEAVSLNPIDPDLLKVDVAPLVPKLRKNKTTHTDYIRHTQDEAATLREIVESCPNRPLVLGFRLLKAYDRRSLSAHQFCTEVSWQHVAKIMGYGDYQIGNVTISLVYYMEGLGHDLFSVGQFCDSDLEVAFCQHTCFIHNLDRVDLLTGSWGNNLYTLSLQDMMASSPISCAMGKSTKKTHKPKSKDTNQEKLYLLHMDLYGPMRVESVNGKKYILVIVDDYTRFTWQNGVVERRNRTLIEAARTMLIYAQAPLFLWSSSGPALNDMTPGTISSGLMRTSSSSTSYVPPSRNDWDLLFQLMFDEILNPPLSVVNQAPEVIAPIAEVIPQVDADSTGSPSSTTVDQDAPSPKHMGNDPLLGVPILEVTSEQSSSTASPQSIVQPNNPMTHHNSKWTKDHPLNNIIGQLSRPVSTRLQLHKRAFFCYYDAFLTSVEPKTYKEAFTQACWIEAI
nr:hypothetical protein [Tanacetum cinerariifolium]